MWYRLHSTNCMISFLNKKWYVKRIYKNTMKWVTYQTWHSILHTTPAHTCIYQNTSFHLFLEESNCVSQIANSGKLDKRGCYSIINFYFPYFYFPEFSSYDEVLPMFVGILHNFSRSDSCRLILVLLILEKHLFKKYFVFLI